MRKQLYDSLKSIVGNTRLEKFKGVIQNGNKIWIKKESENPWGSHYDRVYTELFSEAEAAGKIKPGDKVMETTSGSAGISFAAIGKLLGYECFVALPAGGEIAREKAIMDQLQDKNHLIFTPAESYIAGFPAFLKTYLPSHKDTYFLNHSMGIKDRTTGEITANETTLKALEPIAYEVTQELCSNGVHLDFFVSAIGNGSNTLGVGRVLKDDAKIIGVETFQSGTVFELMRPGEYEKMFGIRPGELPRHRYPGTSYPGISFPHVKLLISDNILDDIVLVSDVHMDNDYYARTGKRNSVHLVHTDTEIVKDLHLGRSTKMALATALEMSVYTASKNFLIIEYDKPARYDR